MMRHGLFPLDDISERNSIPPWRDSDLNLEGKSPGVHPGRYAPELMAECIACLEETASQTLKDQITTAGRYRYRLEGIVRSLLQHIETINYFIKYPEYYLRNDDTMY